MTVTTQPVVGFESLVPAGATCAEEALSPGADRADEHATGRRCAETAMRALGRLPQPVGRGPAGEPLWPAGLVGSITHGAGICAAAVGERSNALAGLGIDVAPNRPLGDRVARRVLPGSSWPGPDGAPDGVHWDSVVFSAKEAVFKAWHPLTATFLQFSRARLDVLADGTISIDLEAVLEVHHDAMPGLPRLRGRFLVGDGVIRTAVVAELQ